MIHFLGCGGGGGGGGSISPPFTVTNGSNEVTAIYSNKLEKIVSRGAVRSAASSYAAMRMIAGSRPVLVIA